MRARVLVRPKAGILDPQGQAVERALPALGFTGVRNVHVGRLVELDVEDPAQLPEMCERLLANPLIEDYEIIENDGAGRGPGVKFGVIRFPGTCDDVDAQLAAAAGRRGRAAVARRPRPAGRRRRRRPRRLLLRRLPARRRDRALRAGDGVGDRVRRTRAGSCSASATASRSSARPGCCPARCWPTPRCVRLPPGASSTSSTPTRRSPATAPGQRSRSRSSTPPAATTRPRSARALEAAGQVVLRYAPGENPNGSLDDIAGVVNERRQRVRPDAASRARRRPAHRLDGRAGRSSSRSAPPSPTRVRVAERQRRS